MLLVDSFTYSKEDVICPLLCLMQQRTHDLSSCGEVEGDRLPELLPRPRDQCQGEIQKLKMNTAE